MSPWFQSGRWLAGFLSPFLASAAPFTNPLLDSGADPWIAVQHGSYFYIRSGSHGIEIFKASRLAALQEADPVTVWRPPESGPYSRHIWAPELHWLQGKWYIYFSAASERGASNRVWVLENASADPQAGSWTMKGKLAAPDDHWAIDGSVFEHHGRLYATWSGWEGEANGQQNIYLAPMSDAWTISGARVRIAAPTLPWEKNGDTDSGNMPGGPHHIDVEEGPELLAHGDKLFLIYSASGCWTDQYVLGMLTAAAGSDLLDPGSWIKAPQPVLVGSPQAHAYATGHCGFFKSPDGREDWIVYHANPEPNQGCGWHRTPRAQRISWRNDGTPDFGAAVPLGQEIVGPSGEPAAGR